MLIGCSTAYALAQRYKTSMTFRCCWHSIPHLSCTDVCQSLNDERPQADGGLAPGSQIEGWARHASRPACMACLQHWACCTAIGRPWRCQTAPPASTCCRPSRLRSQCGQPPPVLHRHAAGDAPYGAGAASHPVRVLIGQPCCLWRILLPLGSPAAGALLCAGEGRRRAGANTGSTVSTAEMCRGFSMHSMFCPSR